MNVSWRNSNVSSRTSPVRLPIACEGPEKPREQDLTGLPGANPVIARSPCDEAIQAFFVTLDCFARARNDGAAFIASKHNPSRVFALLTRLDVLGVLDVEFVDLAGNDEVIVVKHQGPRNPVLIEFERHRIDRRLLAAVGLGSAVVITDGIRPP